MRASQLVHAAILGLALAAIGCSNAAAPCGSPVDCPSTQGCVAGKCGACVTASDCLVGKTCTGGVCGPCGPSSPCAAGLACIAGRCQQCAAQGDCPTGQVCTNGMCGACSASSPCAKGQVCTSGMCGACSASSPCDPKQVCSGGVCGACSASSPCTMGRVCVGGECQPCSTAAPCPTTQVCTSGACGPCSATSPCSLGQVCTGGVCGPCSQANPCTGGLVCTGGVCGACTDPAQCPATMACVAGVCSNSCTSGSQCAAPLGCDRGICAPCSTSGECGTLRCVAGQCMTCSSDGDCTSEQVCDAATHGCVSACPADQAKLNGGCKAVDAPRPVSPLPSAVVTSHRPTLSWQLAAGLDPMIDGAHVDLCGDRACTSVLQSFDAVGSSARVPIALQPGVVYWRLFAKVSQTLGTRPGPVWQFTVTARDAGVDTSWPVGAGDVNGDGYADVVVGAPDSKAVYVFLGGAKGTDPTAFVTLTLGAAGAFGGSVALAGDVNADGFDDVVVGGPDQNRAYVYHGGGAWHGGTSVAKPDAVLTVPASGVAGVGYRVAAAGDVNKDGAGDVLVGTSGPSVVGGQMGPGGAFVFLGAKAGIATTPSVTLSAKAADATGGFSVVSGLGDVNGDGYSDVLVGVPKLAALVYFGSPTGPAAEPSIVQKGAGDYATDASSAGDLDGDGYCDWMVAEPYDATTPTNVYFYLGGPMPMTGVMAACSFHTVYYWNNTDLTPLTGDGDTNGDGYADVSFLRVMAYPGYIQSYFGAPTATISSSACLPFDGNQSKTPAGATSIMTAGDVNGDGVADVVVGDTTSNSASVFFGGSSGIAVAPSVQIAAPSGAMGFGASVGR